MKKCIHCGKEIPDDAEFCGFCGTRQPELESLKETTSAEETTEKVDDSALNQEEEKSSEDSSENANVETTDIDEKESSENVENSSEVKVLLEDEKQPSEDHVEEELSDDTDPKQDSVQEEHEIKDAEIVEPSSETNPETNSSEKTDEDSDSEKKKSDAETVKKSEDQKEEKDSSVEKKAKKPHKDWKKSLPKVNVRKEDFQALADLVKEPTEKQGITNTTTWIILIFAWIANWIAFGSFGAGFVSLLIVLIGLIFINWLTLKDHATFGETVRNSAEVIFPPSLFVFLGGLFIRNIKAGAEVYAFHSIFTTAFIGMFFLTVAMILFLYVIIKKYEMKTWQIVLILTVVVSLLYWYLLTSGMFSLIA